MDSFTLKVTDFTRFPAPRYKSLGPGSGEEFREDYLTPNIERYGKDLLISLDGAMGYGSSFLEEAFGGLVRKGVDAEIVLYLVENNLICNEDASLKCEIIEYTKDAIKQADQDSGQ